MSIVLTLSDGSIRYLKHAKTNPIRRERKRRLYRPPFGSTWKTSGDGRVQPARPSVRLEVWAGADYAEVQFGGETVTYGGDTVVAQKALVASTLSALSPVLDAIVADARDATQLQTPFGTWAVKGLRSAIQQPIAGGFRLDLTWIASQRQTNAFTATGGTTSTDGNDSIHTFSSSGTFEVTNGIREVEYLIVGGGGGGARTGGGGGAGGMLTGTMILTPGEYTVTVGAGGAAGHGSGTNDDQNGSNGGNSAFGSLTAIGAGGGTSTISSFEGIDGGSGGGGGGVNEQGGQGVLDQGKDGGDPLSGLGAPSGGGGGAGVAGSDAAGDIGGNGGDGISSDINGTAKYYAGGGGGGGNEVSGANTGGTGGGGGGGRAANASTNANATAGTNGLGGGGGGGITNTGDGNGRDGGDGIVILRYTA